MNALQMHCNIHLQLHSVLLLSCHPCNMPAHSVRVKPFEAQLQPLVLRKDQQLCGTTIKDTSNNPAYHIENVEPHTIFLKLARPDQHFYCSFDHGCGHFH
jgi:hypothetical protein